MTRQGYIFLGIIALLLALCVASYYNGWHRGFDKAKNSILSRTDTTYIHDTITEKEPVPVYTHTVDTIRVPYLVSSTDTIFVELPREQKVYRDTSYTAYVSGYLPKLDSISIYQKTAIVDHYIETARPSRIAIGIQGGYGITPKGMQPYLGVGVQLNIINIR